MQFIQPSPGNTPPIQILLARVEVASADDLSTDSPQADPPTLREFLDEEDVLRECRIENERLIEYLCRQDIILELVATTFELPPVASPARPNGTGSGSEASSPASLDQEREANLKRAHTASELLTSDNKQISQVVVSDPAVMKKVFSYLRNTPPGQLHNLVAAYFSKLIISLLKIHNALTIEQLSKCDPPFIETLLMHIDSAPIADLIVRLLDAPDPDLMGPHHGNKLPSHEAIQFLISANLLNGLADCFVRASAETLYSPLQNVKPPTSVITSNDGSTNTSSNDDDEAMNSDDDQELHDMRARRRRLREETMSNVTGTVMALTERILQFPELDLAVPDAISPYASPELMSRLLDAGLYASCNPPSIGEDGAKRATPNLGESHAERVAAFSTGNNSALLHSLGLAADLMTAECNIFRDETEDERMPVEFNAGGPSGPSFTGNGIAASVMGGDDTDSDVVNGESGYGAKGKRVPGPLKGKKAGDAIVSTEALATELAVRFSRLSEMFGEVDNIAVDPQRRPLGSLRLKLAEFFVACMKTGSKEIVSQVSQLKVPHKLLELFGRYQWSSMLHGVVTYAIVTSLSTEESCRWARSAWLNAGVIPWLIESWSKSDGKSDNGRAGRAGYMGHLIRIGTALKSFLEEGEQDLDDSELPPRKEIDEFDIFAEEVLVPAHNREVTPLCEGEDSGGGGDADEGEEATDVLDMAGIQFGSLTGHGLVVPGSNLLKSVGMVKSGGDDDEEDEGEIRPVETFEEDIKTVDVDDLDHFGGDTPRRSSEGGKKSVDHDVPEELRHKLEEPMVVPVKGLENEIENIDGGGVETLMESTRAKSNASPEVAAATAAAASAAAAGVAAAGAGLGTSSRPTSRTATSSTSTATAKTETRKASAKEESRSKSERGRVSGSGGAKGGGGGGGGEGVSEDLSGVIDTVDSSSEDEGTYMSFVDEQRVQAKIEADLQRLRIGAEPSASLDAAVTEIDEPAPIMNEMVHIAEDESDNSSDDGYEAWEDPSREAATVPVHLQQPPPPPPPLAPGPDEVENFEDARSEINVTPKPMDSGSGSSGPAPESAPALTPAPDEVEESAPAESGG